MSRRGFLKGLVGIAGIIAAKQAPAFVVSESLMALPQPKKLVMLGDDLVTDPDEILLEMMHIRLAERAESVIDLDGERAYRFPNGQVVKPIIEDAQNIVKTPEIYTGAKPTKDFQYHSTAEEMERFKSENAQYDMYASEDGLLVVPEQFSARVEQLNGIARANERVRNIKAVASDPVESQYRTSWILDE